MRGLSEGTISQHIETLIEEGQGNGLDLDQLLEPAKRLQVEELFNQPFREIDEVIIDASGNTVTYCRAPPCPCLYAGEGIRCSAS